MISLHTCRNQLDSNSNRLPALLATEWWSEYVSTTGARLQVSPCHVTVIPTSRQFLARTDRDSRTDSCNTQPWRGRGWKGVGEGRGRDGEIDYGREEDRERERESLRGRESLGDGLRKEEEKERQRERKKRERWAREREEETNKQKDREKERLTD